MKHFSLIYAGPLMATLMQGSLAVQDNSTEKPPMLQLSSDSTFHFDLLAPFGLAIAGGSDIGPMLGVAQDIEAGNMESFTNEFLKLANHTKAQAEDPENAYDAVNVRDTWFSASNYFRRAANYVLGKWDDPRINDFWAEQTAAFDKGLAGMDIPGERIQIPATEGNFTVEAVWYAVSTSNQTKAPTLIVGNGFDAAQEDSFHVYPVVDYLLREKSDVADTEKLVLLGNSMGGYLAARAAAFEPRLSAVLLIEGMWDFSRVFFGGIPEPLLALYEAGNHTGFDAEMLALRASGKAPTEFAWGMDQGLWAFNTPSPSDLLTRSQRFKVEEFIDNIKVPVFVADAEFEGFFAGQPALVAEALGDRATLHKFTGVAGYHCHVGAGQELARVMFAWLNKTLWKVQL